jgi:hypothetical protein
MASRSPLEKTDTLSTQQQQAMATGNQNTAQDTLSQFEGPVTSSPSYKSLLTTGTDATSKAYNNAQAANRANANQAGFNYASPNVQGSENEIVGQESQAVGNLPAEAAAEAAPLSEAAAMGTAGIGATQSGAAQGYNQTATGLEENYQNAQSGMWDALLGIPSKVAAGAATGAAANPNGIFAT